MADEKNIGTPAEEEIEIITLTDENGEDMDFEFLDLVEYEGKRYAVLLPPVEDNIINLRKKWKGICSQVPFIVLKYRQGCI